MKKTALVLSLLAAACGAPAFAADDVDSGILQRNGIATAVPEDVGLSSVRLSKMHDVMQGYIDREELAGTVTLVARHGKVVHFEAQGQRFVEENLPMTPDTLFRIASMTKPIATVALMMLYEDGHFKLTDPISKWMPEYADQVVAIPAPPGERVAIPYKLIPANKPISMRHVLTHTAGLANTYRGMTRDLRAEAARGDGTPAKTVDESLVRTAKVPLNFHPGEAWEYGGATNIVGVLVERMTGVSLDDFLKARIFEPLGMNDTHFNIPESKIERLTARYAPGEDNKITLAAAPEYREPNTYFSGAGGLTSTITDYYKFCQMLLNGGEYKGVRILGRKTIDLMISNHIGDHLVWLKGPGYGFGLGFSVLLDSGLAMEPLSPGSFGWGGAFNTYFWIDPVEDMICIFMSQIRPYTHLDVRAQTSAIAMQAIIDGPSGEPPRILGRNPLR